MLKVSIWPEPSPNHMIIHCFRALCDSLSLFQVSHHRMAVKLTQNWLQFAAIFCYSCFRFCNLQFDLLRLQSRIVLLYINKEFTEFQKFSFLWPEHETANWSQQEKDAHWTALFFFLRMYRKSHHAIWLIFREEIGSLKCTALHLKLNNWTSSPNFLHWINQNQTLTYTNTTPENLIQQTTN